MALIQETVVNWGLRKCGEISTLLAVGKEEFFLSCEFCDYTVLQLDKFIRHICESHQPEFPEIKTETNLAELTVQLQDKEVGSQWENSDEENDDKDYALRGFERVEIELDTMEMEDSLGMKEEDISEVFVNDKHSLQYIETSDAEMSDVSCYDNKQVGADESGTWVEANFEGNKLHVPSNGRSEFIDTSSCMLQDDKDSAAEKEFNIELIKLYRSLPLLWDTKHKDHNNRILRTRQYDILLAKYKEMYPNGVRKDLLKKINYLQSNYRRELRRVSSHGTSTLYYFDAMDFLRNDEQSSWESQSGVSDLAKLKPTSEAAERYAKPEKVTETVSKSNSSYIQQSEFPRKETGFPQSSKEEQDLQKLTDEQKFIIELIELYRSLPALWNINYKYYNDRESKDIQYNILLEKYKERYPHADKEEVKKKINTLRTNFRRTLKTPYSQKLYYFNAMRFLCNIGESNSTTCDFDDMQPTFEAAERYAKPEKVTETVSKSYSSYIQQSEFPRKETGFPQSSKKEQDLQKLTDEQKFIIELIELYRSLPALWNINYNYYNDRESKDIQYKVLLEKYKERYPHADKEEVKKKINTLRTNFRRTLKTPNSQKLYYFDAMRFLFKDMQEEDNAGQSEDINKSDSDSEITHNEYDIDVRKDREDRTSQTEEESEQNNKLTSSEKEFVIELIKMYRKLPALWHINSKAYHDRLLKSKQYETLLAKYREKYRDATMCDLKRRISNLRSNFHRESKRISLTGETNLYYYDEMRFLLSNYPHSDGQNQTDDLEGTQVTSGLPTQKFTRPDSRLNDIQFIALAKIYKRHTCLWDEKEIAYRFSNRRREALEAIVEELNDISGLNLTKRDLEKEITQLRKATSNGKKEKLRSKRKSLAFKPTCPFYDHISFLEVDVPPFECPKCGQILPGSCQFKIHLASHDGSLPFKCNVCGHGFQMVSNLTVHLRRHAQDFMYSCEVCNKPCATTTELKAHMLFHTGEKPYVCDMCGKSFRLLSKFKYHKDRHEKRPRHKCELCPKAFYNKSMINEHMSVHVKVYDKICDVCDKAFTTQKQLRQHQHIHDAEKKFICKICGKRFAQSAGLSAHMKSHSIWPSPKNIDRE
ncbi:uncharacterized protein LOC128858656 isoform X5 [Anastrepha ludens]|uniref:uncharacterized protein LOC128858656 isoform X5 n=1 Tax=Anastrepha ludens TaxID=28586 RepID=UPI0023AFA5CE|nr:uncharacterized protein LOC128858656 isoform X5 [Anastrepha ludens]